MSIIEQRANSLIEENKILYERYKRMFPAPTESPESRKDLDKIVIHGLLDSLNYIDKHSESSFIKAMLGFNDMLKILCLYNDLENCDRCKIECFLKNSEKPDDLKD